VANRLLVTDEDALGCLARGLPLRVTATRGGSLRAFLSEHQTTLVRLLDHQSDDPVPYLEAAEPITDVAYTELPWDAATACPPELSIDGTRQFALNYNPLNLVWTPHASQALELVHRAPPFDTRKVHALRDAFVAILDKLASPDDVRVDDLL
jgi:hypothetical protein